MDTSEQNDKDAALAVLAAAERRRKKHQGDRDLAVQLARGRGATWTEIAAALWITRQAARQRFGTLPTIVALPRGVPGVSSDLEAGLWDDTSEARS